MAQQHNIPPREPHPLLIDHEVSWASQVLDVETYHKLAAKLYHAFPKELRELIYSYLHSSALIITTPRTQHLVAQARKRKRDGESDLPRGTSIVPPFYRSKYVGEAVAREAVAQSLRDNAVIIADIRLLERAVRTDVFGLGAPLGRHAALHQVHVYLTSAEYAVDSTRRTAAYKPTYRALNHSLLFLAKVGAKSEVRGKGWDVVLTVLPPPEHEGGNMVELFNMFSHIRHSVLELKRRMASMVVAMHWRVDPVRDWTAEFVDETDAEFEVRWRRWLELRMRSAWPPMYLLLGRSVDRAAVARSGGE